MFFFFLFVLFVFVENTQHGPKMGDFNITFHVSTFLVLSVRVVRALENSQRVAAEFSSITLVAQLPCSSATVESFLPFLQHIIVPH